MRCPAHKGQRAKGHRAAPIGAGRSSTGQLLKVHGEASSLSLSHIPYPWPGLASPMRRSQRLQGGARTCLAAANEKPRVEFQTSPNTLRVTVAPLLKIAL
jgi:hypothetical protein